METMNVEAPVIMNPENAVAVVTNGALLMDAQGRVGFAACSWGINPEKDGMREFYPLDNPNLPSVFVPIRY